jgi:UDP-N-acetylglucosamine--N-acetylmuramyl-(pentapeptide) pyrophosphoryl-undecaprenol N-acetylglucosamine transferase
VRVVFTGGGTGGHLYPGLAIARALVRERSDVRPHFVGARRGIESDVLPRTEFPHTLLDLHPLYRSRPWENWRTLRGGFAGWRALGRLSRDDRVVLVVGTGGYASAVAMMWARARGIPVVQHIGDAIPGLAARAFARISRECYLGFPEAQPHLPAPASRYVVTGNPIDPPPALRPDRHRLLEQWRLPRDGRVLLVFGGSQGSLALNEAVAQFAKAGLPAGWSLLWATGKKTHAQFRRLDDERIRVVEYLAPISEAYAVADLALVRGGMMGTAELCAWGVPMVIVPLPTAAADHQTWNARSLEGAGAAVHLPQRDLARLDEVLRALMQDPAQRDSLRAGALRRARPDAARDIARRIAALLP